MAESAAIIGGDGPLVGIVVGVIVPDTGLVGVQMALMPPLSAVPTTYIANTSQATLRPVT